MSLIYLTTRDCLELTNECWTTATEDFHVASMSKHKNKCATPTGSSHYDVTAENRHCKANGRKQVPAPKSSQVNDVPPSTDVDCSESQPLCPNHIHNNQIIWLVGDSIKRPWCARYLWEWIISLLKSIVSLVKHLSRKVFISGSHTDDVFYIPVFSNLNFISHKTQICFRFRSIQQCNHIFNILITPEPSFDCIPYPYMKYILHLKSHLLFSFNQNQAVNGIFQTERKKLSHIYIKV